MTFIVVVATIVVILLIAVVIDVIYLYRNKKKVSDNMIQLEKQKVDDLIQKNEVERVTQLLKGQENERKRISRELHDDLGSMLFATQINYNNLTDELINLNQEQMILREKVFDMIDLCIAKVRSISHDLLEGSVSKLGFKEAVNQLIKSIGNSSLLTIDFDFGNTSFEKKHEIELGLFRITQELLSNTLKYAKAKHVEISVKATLTDIEFYYRDDGIGMDFQSIENSDGIGFKNMRERTKMLDGIMNIQSTPGEGMICQIKIPHGNNED